MLKKLKTKDQGFTIIEVMIVLAIAGLILLIVFLAVPALQRSSRDTQRKNDVSSILGAISTVTNNNNGKVVDKTSQLDLAGQTAIGYYDPSNIKLECAQPIDGSLTVSGDKCDKGTVPFTTIDKDSVEIVQGGKCDGQQIVSGSIRETAILYHLEGGDTTTCQQS